MIPAFFEGTLDSENRKKVLEWKIENEAIFNELKELWESTELLQKMQKYDAKKALESVHAKIERSGVTLFLRCFQRIAAILILPLAIATFYLAMNETQQIVASNEWHTLKTGAGMRSEFVLPDGTKVFLNSNTTLSYPVVFVGKTRDVKIQGEAYFDVAKNLEQPFVLNAGKLRVQVTGTEFKVSNYPSEKLTEIVLVEGSVNLCQANALGEQNTIQSMVPGERATLNELNNSMYVDKVDVQKYIAWKEGQLLFRNDPMDEVVLRLNRWYNVDITLGGDCLGDYEYTATFEDESLIQVLDLLKISAPIDYKIIPRKRRGDNYFSKMKIEITQKIN